MSTNARVGRLRCQLRQWRQHPEFRIAPPVWDAAASARLSQLVERFPAAERAAPEPAKAGDALDEHVLADAVTRLWNAGRALRREQGRPSREARQAARYLRGCQDMLAQGGLIVQDHDGLAFHPGLSLEVLAYDDRPGLTAETVVDTVRPSIYLGERRIQIGQVIVGRPADPNPGVEDASA